MSVTWRGEDEPIPPRPGAFGWVRVVLRLLPMGIVTFGGLIVLLLVRMAEAPLAGKARPVTGRIVQWVCRFDMAVLGIRLVLRGKPMRGRGAVVANHASWLDIFTLGAADRVIFVSKEEVAGWPGIGWLARATGTLFVRRDPKEAEAQKRAFEARLMAGQRLLFFPEGTSTDGQRVLPFKPTLFAAFFAPELAPMCVQPVSVFYAPPEGCDRRAYSWWGDMDFGAHFLGLLAAPAGGRAVVTFHPPLDVAAFGGRKDMARAAEEAVRSGHARGPKP